MVSQNVSKSGVSSENKEKFSLTGWYQGQQKVGTQFSGSYPGNNPTLK